MYDDYEERKFAFPRLPKQGIILHLQMENLIVTAVGIVLLLICVYATGQGPLGALIGFPFWFPFVAIGLVTIRSTPLPVIVWREIMFQFRKLRRRNTYVLRPDVPVLSEMRREGTLLLPGRLQNARLLEADGIAIVHDAGQRTATMIATVVAPSFTYAAPRRQDAMVAGLSSVLRGWTLRPGIKRFTQIARTSTGSVAAERAHARDRVSSRSSLDEARESYEEMLTLAGNIVRSHVTEMAITLDLYALAGQIKNSGGGVDGLRRVALLEAEAIQAALRGAGFVRVEWQSPAGIRMSIRSLLDPVMQPQLMERASREPEAGVEAGGEAVMYFEEHRDFVRTDSAVHRVFWIGQLPAFEVRPGLLDSIIFGQLPDGRPVRHIASITSAPVSIARAMKRIESSKKSWIASEGLRQKRNQITSEADKHEWELLVEQEQALVAGQGEFELSVYIAVSATDIDELDQASSALRTHISNAGMEPHVLVAQQGEALMMCAIPTGEGLA
ncbi:MULTISPECIES: SCO6880 family protein [unclassified Pseudoclavibacter]|uniref:SCO6880 family protein n=1 Tax=unclassified Pseudoclavibacter TaxID=2615177 RepID=UPI001BA65CA3|nr:SCO6880 family protein [Pseudoclavibacter sp. Marseille-Q4354]MBS3177207.1 hypothetical protein [Pseudoclavibacter sp. Marseille-Q4354]